MPLRLAAAAGLPRLVRFLLAQGYTTACVRNIIPEPLRAAVIKDGNFEVIDILTAHGERFVPHQLIDRSPFQKGPFTPFACAIENNCFINAAHLFQQHHPEHVGEHLDYDFVLTRLSINDLGLPLTKLLLENLNSRGMFKQIQHMLEICFLPERIPPRDTPTSS